jgi:hypothetical protein
VDAASIRLPSPVRSGGISIVITAPVGNFKIRWLKMMSGPDNRTAVGRPDGINRRDRCHPLESLENYGERIATKCNK